MRRTMKLDIPRQLELLCTLFETTPEEVIQGFIYDVSQSGRGNGRDECWMSVGYLLRCSYYINSFKGDQAFEMLTELTDIHLQYYANIGGGEKARYTKLKQKQLRAWYKKWKQAKTDYQQKNATIASNNL
jgi:hypothetical protein